MNTCSKCKAKIVKHLWVVDGVIYCSPKCIRDCACRTTRGRVKHVRYCDKTVNKIGCAGIKE